MYIQVYTSNAAKIMSKSKLAASDTDGLYKIAKSKAAC